MTWHLFDIELSSAHEKGIGKQQQLVKLCSSKLQLFPKGQVVHLDQQNDTISSYKMTNATYL